MTYALNSLFEVQITDARMVGATSTTMTSNYRDENTIDALLVTANAGLYTPAMLATMTQNDKVYANRMYNDPASFGTPGTTTGMS